MKNVELCKSLFDLSNKTALVTGGGSGLGRIMANTLATAGARVIIVSRKEKNINETISLIKSYDPSSLIEGFTGDVSTELEVEKIFTNVNGLTKNIDILVNNAGTSWGSKLGGFPYMAWEKIFSVNVSGLFHLTQLLLPLLENSAASKNPSKVLNIGSVMGSSPYGDGAYSYSASKAAVHQLTKILAKELAPRHITVNAIAPGPFKTKMTSFALDTDIKVKSVSDGIPLGRIGNSKDISAITLYLCGQGGNYMTGAILPLDGGLHISTGTELFSKHSNRQLT